MENITEIHFIFYNQDGKNKYRDIIEMHDCVAIIIYNLSREKLLFVKQFRPGFYYINIPPELRNQPIDMVKYPACLGITLELCAGIVDKNKPLVEVAREEVLEECGYDVPVERFDKIHSSNAIISTSGSVLAMFYCEVTDDMKVNSGGGIDDELIDVVELSLEELKNELSKDLLRSPVSVLIAYYWFLHHKPEYCGNTCKKTM